jgi:single-stranded DNA-binding protein
VTDHINHVSISGNVGRVTFSTTGSGDPVCTFMLASDRRARDKTITAWVKVNVYNKALVAICEERVKKGIEIVVSGELMNRSGQMGELTEVRAKHVIFGAGEEHGS